MPNDEIDLSGARFDVRSVFLTRPERWWLANRTLFTELEDPDVAEGQRHEDRDELRWHLLGNILTEVAAALEAGHYEADSPQPGWVTIQITPVAGGLTQAEAGVLESWFEYGEAPRCDAWSQDLTNGRHRLWNVWRHLATAVLPIRSDLLDYTDDVETENLAAVIRQSASDGLQSLPEFVHQRSPKYVAQLANAAQITARA